MMGFRINGMACVLVASLAGLAIGGAAGAATTEGGDNGEAEVVLVSDSEAGVDDGLLYILSLGFAGDFFGEKDKKYVSAESAPAHSGGPTDEIVQVVQTRGDGHPTDVADHHNASPAPEPSAALLMAMGLTVTGMRLRSRARRAH